MKEGWEYKKLGEFCSEVETIKWADNNDENIYHYIDLSAVDRSSSKITETIAINKKNAPSRAKQIVTEGDILFGTTRPLLKRVCLITDQYEGAICSTGFCVLRPDSRILSKYIYFHLLSDKFYQYINPLQSGANYPSVSDKSVKSYLIPVLPLGEQQRIVEELNLLNGIIEKEKAQLEELDKLAQSIFYDMFGDPKNNDFGWETEHFCNLFLLKSGDGLSAKEFKEGIYPVYGGNGISGYHNNYNKEGEYIIVGRVGVYCGNVRVVSNRFWLTDNAFELIMKKDLFNITFLSSLLNIIDLNQYANHAAQPVISNVVLKGIKIPIPPLSLQKEFADKFSAIETMKAKVLQSLKEAEQLFNSRMDYYFN